ncbi:MAG: nickel pincer cofactor biosynthesis protein LarB [Syntrophobacteraceae bacterium]|nr:nickel pincer cofactor biosynthesis protein LarB [Syntrophobacteraceae bacterium]
MDKDRLVRLLHQIREGSVSVERAVEQLKTLPFENLGYARVDSHRCVRTGVPEVIFCNGKSLEQIQGIVRTLSMHHRNVMATWASPEVFEAIQQTGVKCLYRETARIVVINPEPLEGRGSVVIVSAGTADSRVAEEAAVTAEILGSLVTRLYDVGVAGLHRLLDVMDELHNANAIVVVAGMEGALASVVGGLVPCPVIGVPTSIGYGASFGGVAALLSMLNSCAAGVSVVNIDNGFGAGYQASLINRVALGLHRGEGDSMSTRPIEPSGEDR